MFIDYVKIHVIGGYGGSGATSFRREKFVPKGGPDGGDGGRGGSVILRGNKHLRTLQDYSYHKLYKAGRGQHGMGSNKHGRKGKDIVLEVPLGTIVKDAESGQVLGDIVEDGQEIVVARGGRGGRGNARFATPTHRSPREWEPGEPGEDRWIELELKLIADIGLVGLPNAGKSTLLSRISQARPKIADYPFTTLEPNLGIVAYRDYIHFVVADIPGLIEGAHQGKGLGIQFLKHIERTRAIAYLIDSADPEPVKTFETLYNELQAYSASLIKKPALIVLTKKDLQTDDFSPPDFGNGLPVLFISAVRGDHLEELKDQFYNLIQQADKIDNMG
ncbi:GTPase ObgE [Caldithrix abyssi]|uniref:GTPase Obg n=1 Tax=Caldithrix abyssi DSM 13497 TaxID=880073 RepID=H1XUU6_CALAY|nr:GTPase ObgE [Caldithrix abyssi]APF17549.1 obg GTP-binding protein [Caldithrix abyssi DSM 13497]EHO41645.1 GTPase obg [Caldithrix abyssi DSM 13497]